MDATSKMTSKKKEDWGHKHRTQKHPLSHLLFSSTQFDIPNSTAAIFPQLKKMHTRILGEAEIKHNGCFNQTKE